MLWRWVPLCLTRFAPAHASASLMSLCCVFFIVQCDLERDPVNTTACNHKEGHHQRMAPRFLIEKVWDHCGITAMVPTCGFVL